MTRSTAAARLAFVTMASIAIGGLLAGCKIPSGPGSFAQQGTFRALSYNVAGLPQGLSSSNPIANIPQISPLLNGYDLACVQEDFWYSSELAHDALHPFHSVPAPGQTTLVGDGLNRFSKFPFQEFGRLRWNACHGFFDGASDCLAAKGISYARHEVAPGLWIDVYNHHAEAGGGIHDIAARKSGFGQLADLIAVYSIGRAVIVCGDTNLHGFDPDDEPILQDFLYATGLTDSARHLAIGIETIDRFLFRSSAGIELEPRSWRIASEFVDPQGHPLSDHEPIHVDFKWRLK